MAPITDDALCGPDLEYDPECVVLFARVLARSDAQYGDFVSLPEPVNWSDVDRDCRRLMLRTKDIRLAVLFARTRTRLSGAAGLGEALILLSGWLAAFPDTIHPQLSVDADRDAALQIRANALQALADPEGLLADIREITLTHSSAIRLQLRDVERSFACPRLPDALSPDSVSRQLDELRQHHPLALSGFDIAAACLGRIQAWCTAHFPAHLPAPSPDLAALAKLLDLVARPLPQSATDTPEGDMPAPDALPASVEAGPVAVVPRPADRSTAGTMPPDTAAQHGTPSWHAAPVNRQGALDAIQCARIWFEKHEPSSPVPVLLKRAGQLVGKRYAEVAQAIPPDLLAQWENLEDNPE